MFICAVKRSIFVFFVFVNACVAMNVESDIMNLHPCKNKRVLELLDAQASDFESGFCEDPFKQLCVWELKYRIVKNVFLENPVFVNHDDGDALLLHLFAGILLHSESSEQAMHDWVALSTEKYKDLNKFSEKYRRYFNLPEEQVIDLYKKTQKFIKTYGAMITESIKQRMNENVRYDNYSLIVEHRKLASVLERGLSVKVLPGFYNDLDESKPLDAEVVLLEQFKNQRVIEVAGLKNSKVSFLLHDLFDHIWFSSFLDRTPGFMQKYEKFFQKIGNPVTRDLFCREGELTASIAFEFRLYLASNDYVPLYGINEIINVFEKSRQNGTLTPLQEEAYNILKNEKQYNSQFFHSLPFIYSGVMIELMEQRRQYGFIKVHTDDSISYFQAQDPEYAALIVQSCELLWQNIDEVKSILLKIALFGETLLGSSACKKETEAVIARIQDIESLDVSTLPLSKEKVAWFKNNLGFGATRYVSPLEQSTKQESLMNIEFEAKFFVDPESFKKQLEQIGAKLKAPDRLMRRKTFLLPVADLEAQKNMWGRVRDEGDRVTMTVKHLSSATSIDGVREMELGVNDFDKACVFMQLTGCTVKSYQENYRETWELSDCQITIDRWPGLQPFAEIEGPDKKSVEDVLALCDVKAEEIFFGSIDVAYEEHLGIPTSVFNKLPCVTFSTIDELVKEYGC